MIRVIIERKEILPGGFGDQKPDSAFDPQELSMGIERELEHTNSRKLAKEIAKDHLSEDPRYYSRLEDAGIEELELELEEGTFDKEKSQSLHGWFSRRGGKGKSKGWVDCNTCRTDKKTGRKTCQTCGRQDGESRSKYPACRPTPSACNRAGTSKKKSSTRVSWKKKEK